VNIQTLLVVIAVLLLLIFCKLSAISARLKERFPTEKEQDYKWSQDDPMGHYEAHKADKQNK
jgi:hypothetical protein